MKYHTLNKKGERKYCLKFLQPLQTVVERIFLIFKLVQSEFRNRLGNEKSAVVIFYIGINISIFGLLVFLAFVFKNSSKNFEGEFLIFFPAIKSIFSLM